MGQGLQGIPRTKCYCDDIIVTGENGKAHLRNWKRILEHLETNCAKCKFFNESFAYCEHVANGLHASQEKMKELFEAPQPKDVS